MSRAQRNPPTPLPWWRRPVMKALFKHLLVSGLITLGICVLAHMLGFRLNIIFLVLVGMLIGAGIWLVRYVVEPGREVSDQPPVLDVLHLQSRNSDPRTRKIEEFLYGSQPRFNMASPQLQKIVADLVADRVDEDRSRLSPELRRYIETTPAPPIDRRRIRLLIKEIAAL